jgi:hypothetical protein
MNLLIDGDFVKQDPPSLIFDPGVNQRVQEIDGSVDQDERRGDNEYGSLDSGVVSRGYRVYDEPADA